MTDKIVVVSTAFDEHSVHEQHHLSVGAQTINARLYLRFGPAPCAQNLYEAIHALDPSTIVVWLDADDYLATPKSLEVIAKAYENPDVWMTYGQFMYENGERGFAHPWMEYGWTCPTCNCGIRNPSSRGRCYTCGSKLISLDGIASSPRGTNWFATHLKTFRAGLFQKIYQASLFWNVSTAEGLPQAEWIPQAVDMAVMFPMLEMTGPEHASFIPNILCVYTGSHYHGTGSTTGEQECERYIRSQKPYDRLLERPW